MRLLPVLTLFPYTTLFRSRAVGASKVQAVVHSTVLLATHVIDGAVVSVTVTVWLQSAWLPQASVARQVRVALCVLPQCRVLLVTVLRILMALVPQVSVAVG